MLNLKNRKQSAKGRSLKNLSFITTVFSKDFFSFSKLVLELFPQPAFSQISFTTSFCRACPILSLYNNLKFIKVTASVLKSQPSRVSILSIHLVLTMSLWSREIIWVYIMDGKELAYDAHGLWCKTSKLALILLCLHKKHHLELFGWSQCSSLSWRTRSLFGYPSQGDLVWRQGPAFFYTFDPECNWSGLGVWLHPWS